MSNTPSDAEIVAVMRDGYNCRYNDEQDHIDFARTALAKWGTPQPPSEPFTKAQQERLYQNRPANVCKGVSLADWRRTVEFIEAAHRIAGRTP